MVLPIDKAMPDLHRVVGISIVFASIVHSIAHVVTYTVKNPWKGGFGQTTYLFITGVILLFLILVVRIAARSAVQYANYEAFFRIHVGGSLLVYGFLIVHGLHHGVLNSWKWVIGPIAIYFLDIIFRTVTEKRSFLLISKHSATFQGPDIMKIRLPRVFHFEAGQYAELKVPQISRLQWHPFTIASAPHESEMVFYIKAVGDWTIELYQLFSERLNIETGRDIEVHIRGPYGAPAQHVGQFERVILVGGGVGATPFCSVVKDTHNWMTNWTPKAQRHEKKAFAQREGRGRDPTSNGGSKPQTAPGARFVPTPSEPYHRAVPLYSQDRVENRRREVTLQRSASSSSSHLFTTNVYSEHFETLGILESAVEANNAARKMPDSADYGHAATGERNKEDNNSPRFKRIRTSSYTARDYLGTGDISSSTSLKTTENASTLRVIDTSLTQDSRDSELEIVAHDGDARDQPDNESESAGSSHLPSKTSQMMVRDDGMGSYHENSMGTFHRSLDYMAALHSVYDEPAVESAVFHESLDLMVAMNFGSVSLVRNMQKRKAQLEMRRSIDRQLPTTVNSEDLSLFHSNRVMFLLFMKSVTMNMILLWLLILRFVIAGVASIFGEFDLVHDGVTLFNNQALNAVDLVFSSIIALLIGIPAVLETMEVGLRSVQSFDLFVVMPSVVLDVIVGSLSIAKAGEGIPRFTLFRVFLGWPVISLLVLIRLFRVIGERVAQAQNLATNHTTTKAVDFYWTAPTPEDDRWLVKELAPYANLKAVQLHRHLTRCQRRDGKPGSTRIKNARYMYTNYGRPDWEEIMNEMTEHCPNNTTVGVFFCGPRKMGEQVQKACMSAMRNSIVRGLHAGVQQMRTLEEVFGDAMPANEYTGESPRPGGSKTGGCNVKIVFKRETFS
ncbi:Superoxide-generating NADPH oxidase heavy chain subunit A [Gracilariopsis chorda]|uniref:Superoxide-generating NADPH oxidase heavy chain subunit A n=1 Tax=Gracilariopsis chorda TaxID=448386 RepID=A0A2V3IH31_9FLOR|nr:Superoxide-generating NADPH oxidase heavy chain subunit A [Gracilariopsis chorda]|eukprot:PXF41394.1 Superoxide-generating NADPH oxidase heavy chain subunit A [Gracilariopsis chorda]